jgi:mevalonate kinase
MTQREVNGVKGLESNHIHLNGVNGSTNGNTNGNGVKTDPKKKMDRKKSSPMLPTFMVSAPGKVIVCGEHAVVHGKASTVCASASQSRGLSTTRQGSARIANLVYCRPQ